MALSITDQADLAIRSLTFGDIDLFSRVLTDPATVSPEDQRTAAQRLGFKGRFLESVVNVAADPTVWVAFLMSKRFPTLSWLTGAVPTRFVGATNNQFSGISMFTRPVETYFRGTTIPKLTALAQHREMEVMRVGGSMLEKLWQRPNWKEEMPLVTMLLEGQAPAAASPELRKVADEVRVGMEELWGMLARTKKISGGFGGEEITKARAMEWLPEQAPRHLRDYVPHIPLHADESLFVTTSKEAMTRLGMGKSGQVFQAFGIDPKQVWSVDAAGRLSSNFDRYQAMLNTVQGQVWSPHLFQRQRFNVPLQSQQGQELFVTDLNLILQKYIRSVAKTYSLNAPISDFERSLTATRLKLPDGREDVRMANNDPLIVQIINEGLESTGHVFKQFKVAGTDHVVEQMVPQSGNAIALTALRDLTRSVRGLSDEGEILWGNLFSAAGRHFDEAVGPLRGKQYTEVDRAMRAMRRNQTARTLSDGITSYFYSTTLGLNGWSALQNLLQPIMTTGPAIGLGPTLSGMKEMSWRMKRYASEFGTEYRTMKTIGQGANWFGQINEAAQRAFGRAFPELASSGIKPDPRLFDVNPKDVGEVPGRFGKAFRSYDQFARFLLQPFTHAELANQASAFYGARKAIKDSMRAGLYEIPTKPAGADRFVPLDAREMDQWVNFEAGNVVNATQFRPGPGGRTIWQNRMPSFMRMFTTFPLRMLSFMGESTIRGAMSDAELAQAGTMAKITGGRNLGTLSRIYMYSRIAVEGAKNVLGVDLSGSLGLTTPLTVGPQGRTPAPFVLSPVATTAIGVVSAASNRDIKELQPMEIPGYGQIPVPRSLIPAGVATSRVARSLRQWRPDVGGFVDDQERLMYQGNESDLVLSMLGVPLDKGRRLRNDIERTDSIRQRARDIRRRYAVSNANYDVAGMRQTESEWNELFKGKVPFSVADSDVRRYHEAARTPVVQRMIETMGSSGGYLHSQIYEVDPDLVGAPEAAPEAGFP